MPITPNTQVIIVSFRTPAQNLTPLVLPPKPTAPREKTSLIGKYSPKRLIDHIVIADQKHASNPPTIDDYLETTNTHANTHTHAHTHGWATISTHKHQFAK